MRDKREKRGCFKRVLKKKWSFLELFKLDTFYNGNDADVISPEAKLPLGLSKLAVLLTNHFLFPSVVVQGSIMTYPAADIES